jgi:hypothetical protein
MFKTVLTWSESWNPGVSTIVKFGPLPTQGPTAYVVSLVQELPPPSIKIIFRITQIPGRVCITLYYKNFLLPYGFGVNPVQKPNVGDTRKGICETSEKVRQVRQLRQVRQVSQVESKESK